MLCRTNEKKHGFKIHSLMHHKKCYIDTALGTLSALRKLDGRDVFCMESAPKVNLDLSQRLVNQEVLKVTSVSLLWHLAKYVQLMLFRDFRRIQVVGTQTVETRNICLIGMETRIYHFVIRWGIFMSKFSANYSASLK